MGRSSFSSWIWSKEDCPLSPNHWACFFSCFLPFMNSMWKGWGKKTTQTCYRHFHRHSGIPLQPKIITVCQEGAIICIFFLIIIFLLFPTLLATRMTGTSSEARTLAIRLRYSTASLKLCLQKEKEKALPLVAEDNGHNSDNPSTCQWCCSRLWIPRHSACIARALLWTQPARQFVGNWFPEILRCLLRSFDGEWIETFHDL